MGFRADLEAFYTYLESERRYSPHTLQAYRRDLGAFVEFSRQRNIDRWKKVDDMHVRRTGRVAVKTDDRLRPQLDPLPA